MRHAFVSRRLSFVSFSALAFALVHCGGDDGGGGVATEDSGAIDSTTPTDSAPTDGTVTDTAADSGLDSASDSAPSDAIDGGSDVPTDTTPPPPGTWRQAGGPSVGALITDFAFNGKGDVYLVNDAVYVFKRPKLGTWQIVSNQLSYVDSAGFDSRLESGPVDEVYMWPTRTENWLSKTADDGATWSHKWDYTMLPGKSGGFTDVAVSASGWVFLESSGGTGYSFRRSKDGGATWTNYAAALGSRVTASGKNVFVYSDTLQRSSDEGDTFTASVSGLPATGVHLDALTMVGTTAYLLVEDASTADKSVWKSSDSGATWTKTTIVTPMTAHWLVADGSVTSGARLFIAGESDLVVTNDGGATSTATKPYGKVFGSDLRLSAFAVNATGEIFVGLRGAGVSRSTDHGLTFSAYDETLSAVPVGNVIVRKDAGATGANGDLFCWGPGAGFVQRSSDDGKTWTMLTTAFVSSSATNDVAVSPKGTLFVYDQRSLDNGATFTASQPAGVGTINFHAFAASGDVLLGTSTGLYRSTDEGVTWGTADATMASTSNLVVGKGIVVASKGFALMKSTDDGKTWAAWTPDFSGAVAGAAQAKPGLALPDGTLLFTLDTYPAPSLKRVATLARSTDNGVTWTAVGTFPAGWTRTAMTSDAAGNAYFAYKLPEVTAATTGETHAVFRSSDKGATWSDITPSMINIPMPSLTTNKLGTLFAATAGAGVWVR